LNFADELLAITFDLVNLVVRQLCPFRLSGTLELLPFAFQFFAIHSGLHLIVDTNRTQAGTQRFRKAWKCL